MVPAYAQTGTADIGSSTSSDVCQDGSERLNPAVVLGPILLALAIYAAVPEDLRAQVGLPTSTSMLEGPLKDLPEQLKNRQFVDALVFAPLTALTFGLEYDYAANCISNVEQLTSSAPSFAGSTEESDYNTVFLTRADTYDNYAEPANARGESREAAGAGVGAAFGGLLAAILGSLAIVGAVGVASGNLQLP